LLTSHPLLGKWFDTILNYCSDDKLKHVQFALLRFSISNPSPRLSSD
jgi:hypothetical protein